MSVERKVLLDRKSLKMGRSDGWGESKENMHWLHVRFYLSVVPIDQNPLLKANQGQALEWAGRGSQRWSTTPHAQFPPGGCIWPRCPRRYPGSLCDQPGGRSLWGGWRFLCRELTCLSGLQTNDCGFIFTIWYQIFLTDHSRMPILGNKFYLHMPGKKTTFCNM